MICQTLVRVLEIPHAETNATILPRALEAMRDRAPDGDRGPRRRARHRTRPRSAAASTTLGGGRRHLGDIGADAAELDDALDAMLERGELQMTPDPPDRDELRRIIESAW